MVGLVAVTSFIVFNQPEQKPFYVGVTYGGSSIQEAKELVDRVKDYTNLFVLQSGHLQADPYAMEEIGIMLLRQTCVMPLAAVQVSLLDLADNN
ncbi:hypothetical protein [Candidatus Bathycorpusculum sp.]|uniref:hypothetical protein n=1 Tax=Candidatus Bathycorpusculum sp. TaxID=2994959 RepID=UPI00282F14C5|nr:hypothetical protein [Candidatus Termitimicrobium sp.]MCL2432374.1 hypothetical protein [Candidatus Termitimicrobium sp.]